MLVSRAWLEAFLRRPLPLDELGDRLAMLGEPVEGSEPLFRELGDVVVGEVEAVHPHPNADRLQLCVVNDGGTDRYHVVCGATNVQPGKKYPFARVGAVLPGGLTIEKRTIRGEVSSGMLCSARELGVGEDHEGILELETTRPAGTPLLEALPIADDRLEIEVNPNRPDLLGHKGVARDLAAALSVPFRLPPIPGSSGPPPVTFRREAAETSVDGVRVAIEDPDGCARFVALVLRDVRVGPSPGWLQHRIHSIGMRPVNNIVDATNYVMVELGQPMHPYDLAKLNGPSVIVRRAASGERLTTLDGKERTLTADMTVIADEGGAIGIAGVMGGGDSEVSAETQDVFLECAWFAPSRLRRTRKALGMNTEASYRFERGVDLQATPEAVRRCLELMLATAGGTLAEPPADLWPSPTHPPRIFLRPARVAQILGVEVPWEEIEQHLVAIGATVVAKPDDARMAVDVPGWRPDLTGEIDLIEEIARFHGYDRFPSELRPFRLGTVPDADEEVAATRVRDGLTAGGLHEVGSLPMGTGAEPGSVPVVNPRSHEEAYLRRRLLPGLIRHVEGNWAVGVRDVRLFEIGTVFALGDPGARPREERHLAGVVSGARDPAHWTRPSDQPDWDVWDLKGVFEQAVGLAYPSATVQVDGTAWIASEPDGRIVGRAERLFADAPPWAGPAFGFEVVLDPSPRSPPRFEVLPSTPASTRDVALVVPAGVTVAAVHEVVVRTGGSLLESADLVSEYRGPDLPDGTRSVAFHLTLRSSDRTLRDAEVDRTIDRILDGLKRELGIERRGAQRE